MAALADLGGGNFQFRRIGQIDMAVWATAEQRRVGGAMAFQPLLQLRRVHAIVIARARQHQQMADV